MTKAVGHFLQNADRLQGDFRTDPIARQRNNAQLHGPLDVQGYANLMLCEMKNRDVSQSRANGNYASNTVSTPPRDSPLAQRGGRRMSPTPTLEHYGALGRETVAEPRGTQPLPMLPVRKEASQPTEEFSCREY